MLGARGVPNGVPPRIDSANYTGNPLLSQGGGPILRGGETVFRSLAPYAHDVTYNPFTTSGVPLPRDPMGGGVGTGEQPPDDPEPYIRIAYTILFPTEEGAPSPPLRNDHLVFNYPLENLSNAGTRYNATFNGDSFFSGTTDSLSPISGVAMAYANEEIAERQMVLLDNAGVKPGDKKFHFDVLGEADEWAALWMPLGFMQTTTSPSFDASSNTHDMPIERFNDYHTKVDCAVGFHGRGVVKNLWATREHQPRVFPVGMNLFVALVPVYRPSSKSYKPVTGFPGHQGRKQLNEPTLVRVCEHKLREALKKGDGAVVYQWVPIASMDTMPDLKLLYYTAVIEDNVFRNFREQDKTAASAAAEEDENVMPTTNRHRTRKHIAKNCWIRRVAKVKQAYDFSDDRRVLPSRQAMASDAFVMAVQDTLEVDISVGNEFEN